MNAVTKRLLKFSVSPSEGAAFDTWVSLADVVPFLRDHARSGEMIVYAGLAHTFLHAVLVPASSIDPLNMDDLDSWSHNPFSSWGISYRYSAPPEVSIESPLDDAGSKTLEQGEQLVYGRTFEGRLGDKDYFEALQKFVHIFGLHFIPERSAYCRLDQRGDIEDVIRIIDIPAKGKEWGGTIITFDRQLVDEYAAITDSVVLLMFDFTRWDREHFSGWSKDKTPEYMRETDLFYRSLVSPGHSSYMRGCHIIRPTISKDEIAKCFVRGDEQQKQFASFIAYDWKNRVVREISCAPRQTSNYFTESDLPFEMSPAFFRADVLTKYKADSEKYRLQDRSISCRGTWHLETYDINEAGQVHTYIVYLRRLPYEEQLYWKSYNEEPKASISERAFKTDFQGCWDIEYDPLVALREKILQLNRARVPWWTLRSEKLVDQVHYPATLSSDEWADEILLLDQLIVEGFEEKWLRKKAEGLGRSPDAQFRSLKLVEECLIALGFKEDQAREITASLRHLHDLRSKVKGHASDTTAIRQKALSEHKTYRKHFRSLCKSCDDSMATIIAAFKTLT